MKHSTILKYGLILTASVSLTGCELFESGGGGGGVAGGGMASFANYQGEFDRVTGVGPTSDMPTSLKASYSGALKAEVNDGSEVVGEVVADLDLDVDWNEGQMTNPFSGGASNFQSSDDGGTTVVPIDGELTVDDTLPGAITRNETVVNLPGGGTQTVATGALIVHLSGDLTLGDETATTTVQMGGAFFGPGATAASGPVVGGFKDPDGGQLNGIFDGTIGGTYYMEQN